MVIIFLQLKNISSDFISSGVSFTVARIYYVKNTNKKYLHDDISTQLLTLLLLI